MIRLSVPDMNCGHCKASVEQAIASLDAGATVRADISQRLVEVETALPAPALIEALDEIGFPAAPA